MAAVPYDAIPVETVVGVCAADVEDAAEPEREYNWRESDPPQNVVLSPAHGVSELPD